MSSYFKLKFDKTVIVAILLLHATILAIGSWQHSPSFDEVGHLPAGLAHWLTGRFDLYRVNPPLVRMIATLPLLFDPPEIDFETYPENDPGRQEFLMGQRLISKTGSRSFWWFTIARWSCIPLSILGACISFCWARQLYGTRAGLIALALWCSCPNILGNGQMITPDVGAAALGLAACFFFWNWLKAPQWSLSLLAGLLLGLAELARSTWLVLFILYPLLWLVWGTYRRFNWLSCAPQLVVTMLLGLLVLNLGYGFEGSFESLSTIRDHKESLIEPMLYDGKPHRQNNHFADNLLDIVPIPLPRNYLLGICAEKKVQESAAPSYLRGKWKRGAWWYYYLYGLTVKMPLGTLALVVLGIALWVRKKGYECWKSELMVVAPAIAIVVLVSYESGHNHHFRYILPAIPFVYILISKVGHPRAFQSWIPRLFCLVLLFVSILSSILVFPHSLSYFNELAGGPRRGHEHMLHSGIDWGQDLFYLKKWLDAHPHVKELKLAYYGSFDPQAAGINFTLPVQPVTENSLRPGWYAISVTLLCGYKCMVPDGQGGFVYLDNPCLAILRETSPVAIIGYSIYVYYVDNEKVDGNARGVSSDFDLVPICRSPIVPQIQHQELPVSLGQDLMSRSSSQRPFAQ